MTEMHQCDELTPGTIEKLLAEQIARSTVLSRDLADLAASVALMDTKATAAFAGHETRITAGEHAYAAIVAQLGQVATRRDIDELKIAIMSGRNDSIGEDLDIQKSFGKIRERVARIESRAADKNVKSGALGGSAVVILTMVIAIIAGLLGIEIPL